MFYDGRIPDVAPADWESFRNGYSPALIEEVIDREQAGLADWFLPLSRGIAIASVALLRQTDCRDGKWPSREWWEQSPGFFTRKMPDFRSLIVRQSNDDDLWSIERWNAGRKSEVDEVLVFYFGATPIFTRSHTSGMRLAMRCHLSEPPHGLRWFKGPLDVYGAMEFVKKRSTED